MLLRQRTSESSESSESSDKKLRKRRNPPFLRRLTSGLAPGVEGIQCLPYAMEGA